MKISVLLSIYINDDPNYLKCALNSIYFDQTRKPDEIVIVFDGQLNESLYDVVNEFTKDIKDICKIIPLEENHGLGEALRIGSLSCTGDYIFRMDADDISIPKRFETQVAYLEENPLIDVLGSDIAEFETDPSELQKRIRSCPSKHIDIVKMSKKRNPMNHVSVAIKRSALIKSGGYKSMLLVEDYYLWLNMILSGCTLANIHESLVLVRLGSNFEKKRSSKKIIKGWKSIQDFMVKNHMISSFRGFINMIYIRLFITSSSRLKKIVYRLFLRK